MSRILLNVSDFKNVCRGCLSTTNNVNIFENMFNNIRLDELFKIFTGIEAKQDDGLSPNICDLCITVLTQLSTFKKQCIESDEVLRRSQKADMIKAARKPRPVRKKVSTVKNIPYEETIKSTKVCLSYLVMNGGTNYLVKYKKKKKPRTYECLQCKQNVSSLIELRTHQKIHNHSNKFAAPCPHCNKTITNYHMKQHIETHSKERPHECGQCQKKFKNKFHLRRHVLNHSGLRPHVCDICGKGYAQAPNLVEHRRMHTGEKPNVCPYCGLRFGFTSQYRTHLKKHISEKGGPTKISKDFKCIECNRAFATRTILNKHSLIHGEKNYLCYYCGKRFFTDSGLTSHIKVHSSARPYKCEICNKSFRERSTLKCHLGTHSELKPFSCEICCKTFKQSWIKKHHLRVHSGEKPYSCIICNKSFTVNGALTSHMRTHTGEAPYSCDICNRSFRNLHNMKKHKKIHLKNNSTKNDEILDENKT